MKLAKAALRIRSRTAWSSACCWRLWLFDSLTIVPLDSVPVGTHMCIVLSTTRYSSPEGSTGGRAMATKVLVTGASGGRQGQTGRHVSEMLLARGVPVRAFVHRRDERSERLDALGAEIVEGDFLDIRSVQRAVQGISAVYFAY